jgi:hypothetical protein
MFSVEINDRKESEEGKKHFQNKCVSSKNKRMRKEEGATVAASHLPSLSGQLHCFVYRPDRQRLHRRIQTIWKLPLTT